MSEFSVAKLVELLGIEECEKNNFAFEGKLCRIIDVEINSNLRKFLIKFKDEEITFEFWRCNFSSDINLTNLEILPKLIFSDCVFKKLFIARGSTFENEIEFCNCIFYENFECNGTEKTEFKKTTSFFRSTFRQQTKFSQAIFQSECDFRGVHFEENASFDSAEFQAKVDFGISRFMGEARFIGTKFLAKTSDNKTYENNFREVRFEGNTSFDSAEFQAKVDFSISRFMSEARFIKTQFLAKISDNKTYENNFREVRFGGRVDFSFAIFRGKVDFSISRFMGEARFAETQFLAKTLDDKIYENNFKETRFEGKASFSSAVFQAKVDFSISRFMGEARFIETQFLAQTSDGENYENRFKEVYFYGGVVFSRNNFKGRIDFSASYSKNSRFRGIDFPQSQIDFVEAVFEGMKIIRCYFPATISFDKCTFRNTLFQNKGFDEKMFFNVRFEDCVFKETNTFGENIFIDKPLFENCTFEGQFNIKHCFLHYEFESLEISSQIKPDEQTNKMITWRETFRRLKGNRLTYHNLIDASELRTQELYARELELKSKTPPLFSKEWLEKWQLCLYRLTSDHHTDLAKIFNNVVLLIAIFGIFSFGLLDFSANPNSTIDPKVPVNFVFGKISLLPKNLVWIFLGSCLGLWGFFKLLNIKKDKLLKCFGYATFISCMAIPILFCGWTFFKLASSTFQEVCLIFGICISFIVGYLCLIRFADQGIILIAYSTCIGILIFKPSLLFPFVGQLFDEGLKANFPAMQSLSVVYCILMFLLLFSLQKTARKNSIVPS